MNQSAFISPEITNHYSTRRMKWQYKKLHPQGKCLKNTFSFNFKLFRFTAKQKRPAAVLLFFHALRHYPTDKT
jgi:hypothetical protein